MKELLRKKYIKILLSLITLLVVIGIVGINVRSSQKDKDYKAHIAAAEKYLSDLDYEQAIAEYTKALEIDPKEEVVDALAQAYLDYAKSYADTGDYEKAASILEESYEKINPKEEVVDTLEQIYLAYAQAYIDAEDYDKAVSILKEKSERTGWKSLQNMIVEVKALQEQKRIEEEEKASGMVEFPFRMSEITVMGYDLFGDHFAQVEELIRAEGEVLWQESEGEYPMASIRIPNDRLCDINTQIKMPDGMNYRSIQVMHKCDDALFYRDWTYAIDDARDGLRAILSIDSYCEARHVFGYAELNVPVKASETYGDWCRVMQVDRIKENNLRPEEHNGVVGVWKGDVCIYDASWFVEAGFEIWCFSTEQYQGIYIESDRENREDGIKECEFIFLNPVVYGGREESIQSIVALVNVDDIIVNIDYYGRPIAE